MDVHPFKPIFDDNKNKTSSKLHCTACGQLTDIETCGNGPDNGLHLTGFGGYYGGFTDCVIDSSDDSQSRDNAWFCHDCCVKLFEMFPHLAKAVKIKGKYSHESRHHPCQDQVPCCRYAWKVARDPHDPDEPVDLYAYYDPQTRKLEWRPLEPF